MRTIKLLLLILVFVLFSTVAFADELNLVYDQNGNLLRGDGYNRTYNSLNQLAEVRNESGTLLESFEYHPTQERVHVKKEYYANGSVKETTIYVSETFLRIINSSGEFDFAYVYQDGGLVAEIKSDGSKQFSHSDHLKSSVIVTDESGNVLENTSYEAWGNILEGGEKSRFDFTGQEFDSVIGDYDYNARRYKAEWGRFVQPDKIVSDVYNPQELNHYTYVRTNPYKFVDPFGLWALLFGGSASGGVQPVGGTIGGGIIISYSKEGGFQFGFYGTYGAGGYIGGKGSLTLDLAFNPKAKNIKDMAGLSLTTGGSGGPGWVAGGDIGVPSEYNLVLSDPTFIFHFGLGAGSEGHSYVTKTGIFSLYIRNPYISQATNDLIKRMRASGSSEAIFGSGGVGGYVPGIGYVTPDGRVYPTTNPDWVPTDPNAGGSGGGGGSSGGTCRAYGNAKCPD